MRRPARCRSVCAAITLLVGLPAGAAAPPDEVPPDPAIEAELADEIDDLIVRLGDGGSSWWATKRLATIGAPAVGPLEDRVLGADPTLRRTLVTTLAQIEGTEQSPFFQAGLALALADAVDDLRHDSVRWNAGGAMRFLRAHAAAARPLLEAALDSDDHQQRQMAAAVLRGVEPYRPTPRMLAVTVEGLRDDVLPAGRRPGEAQGTYTCVYNAVGGVRWLLRDRDRIRGAEMRLVAALASDDGQQRFLAAYVLGMGGCAAATGEIVPVLLPHLADNAIWGDANMAAAALYGLGPTVVPQLRAQLAAADAQSTVLLRLIIYHLAGPDDPDAAMPAPAQRKRITGLVHDPVRHHRFISVPSGLAATSAGRRTQPMR